jgi:ankyrin repeat protein
LDLGQLRRQAKELRDAARAGEALSLERILRHVGARGPGEVTLAIAQLVIARELGFASWPKLKVAVESRAATMQRAAAFVAASVEDRERRARILLDDDPGLARADIRAAAVVGDARLVAQLVAADPSAANAVDRERGWPALLYVCYSRWHRIDPGRAAGMVEVARLLLDAGVSPDTNNGARPHHGYRSALHGSVTANNPAITRLLLERSANPSDGESLYQAAGDRDHECLRLLLTHGATVAGSWAVDVAVGGNDAEGAGLLLDAAKRQTPERVSELASGLLARACAAGFAPVVEELLAGGAKPSRLDQDGLSPLRRAVRAGHQEVVAVLLRRGVIDDATDIDRFFGASARGDRLSAETLLSERPGLRDRLCARDRAAIVEVAGGGGAAVAVRLMIELGFSPNARNDLGETPLHAAAAAGDAETVRLLLEHGAELDARDANFDGTPLGYATVTSGEHPNINGDWAATVQLLLNAGADPTGVWVPGRPPSEDVAEALRNYGITSNETPAASSE